MKKVKLLALLSAVVTAVLLYFFLSSLGNETAIPQKEVITASVNIPPNTEITESMLSVTRLPEDAVHQNAIKDSKLALGKVSSSDIIAGEQILDENLIEPGKSSNGTLAYAIEPGMRAFTISVDSNSGLSDMLKPQNRVDILGLFEDPAVSDVNSNTYSTLILDNIKILAVDSVLSEKGKANQDGIAMAYSTITLQVTPEEALELNLAAEKGQLRAVLRSPLDEEAANLPSVTLKQIMKD